MKCYIYLLALIFGFQLTTMAQKSKPDKVAPKEDIRVNREFDENGNLIKFDSTYTYRWSNDTTLIQSFTPEDLSIFFRNQSKIFNDSTFFGDLFFDDFDQLFFSPFSNRKDSILNLHRFKNTPFSNDTIASKFFGGFDFFDQFLQGKHDKTSSGFPDLTPFRSNSKSLNDIMKMFQQQIQEMEEYHQKFFREQSKSEKK